MGDTYLVELSGLVGGGVDYLFSLAAIVVRAE